MMPWKKILTYAAVYLVCVGVIGAGVYIVITFYAQKTLYLDKKQWHPAEPKAEQIDPVRLNRALEYVRTRLPTARSVLVLRNGKTVAEKYYWHGGPEETDYLHSLNLPLLQVLIGIAIDRQMIKGPEQALFDFCPKQLLGTQFDSPASLKLSHLLNAQAPLLWGSGSSDYWDLFYAMDRNKACLQAVYRHQTQHYSAVNFASAYLLSQVIEQVSGQSLIDFADQYLFQPLGITTYAEDNKLSRDPLIGFQLKPLDLAKIGYLLLQEGAWQGRQILSKEWIRWIFSRAPLFELDDVPGGSWVKTIIRGYESLLCVGEGGQYLVLVPALQMVVVSTSTSTFALPQENGHDRLLQLVIESVLPTPNTNDISALQRQIPETAPREYTDALAPNYVSSTPVPQEILNFFHQFAEDIVSKDKRRLAANYARIYDFGKPPLFSRNWSSARLMLSPVPPLLEYVYITKIRIEKNRAYLRGSVKFNYRTYAGSQGVFPLENLIKLKGRWKWLGLPEKTAILDRDDYFDAELSEEHQRFVDDCSDPLLDESELSDKDCVAESFLSAERGQNLLAERLHPLLKGRSGLKLHVTAIQKNGVAYQVQGYVEGSALGDLRLPNDLYIVKENGDWKWQIGDLKVASMSGDDIEESSKAD
jgi:hypothetical protein